MKLSQIFFRQFSIVGHCLGCWSLCENQDHITKVENHPTSWKRLMNRAQILAVERTWDIWHLERWRGKSFMPENYTVHENNCDRARRSERWKMAASLGLTRENGQEINRKRGTSSIGNESHVECIKSAQRNHVHSDRLGGHGPPFTTKLVILTRTGRYF